MATEIDYYERLEVSRSADDGTIKTSYRKLAMKFHPDRNQGDAGAEAQFKAINQAYDVLKDPQKRAAYDRYGHAAYEQAQSGGGGGGAGAGFGGFNDLGDIFESFFGGGFGANGSGGRQQARRGADLRYDMEISLEDAFHGKVVEIAVEVAETCDPCGGKGGTGIKRCGTCGGHGQVRSQQGFFMVERACPKCHGRGEVIENACRNCGGEGRVEAQQKLQVQVPVGVDTGTRLRVSGKGEAGPNGTPPGDLYIFFHIRRHRVFERDGTTLVTRAPISFTTAALGGEIAIPGLDGTSHAIPIPAGIQSGKQLRKRGAGMPALNGRGVGDMVVEIAVETPTKLTARQKEILRELQGTETGEECPESKGFFERIKDALSGE